MSEVRFCPSCGTPRTGSEASCARCGTPFPDAVQPAVTGAATAPAAAPPGPAMPPPPPPPPPPMTQAPVHQQPTWGYPPPYPQHQQHQQPAAYQGAGWEQAPPPPRPGGLGITAPPGVRTRPLALVGALAVGISPFLPWLSGGGLSIDAFDIGAGYLLSGDALQGGGFTVGLLLLLVGLGGVVLSFLPLIGSLRRTLGMIGVGVPIALVGQAVGAGADLGEVISALSVGPYVALVGGVLLSAGK